MHQVDCSDARALINLQTDYLLETGEAVRVMGHLHQCPSCFALWQGLEGLRKTFQSAKTATSDKVGGDALSQRISQTLRKEERECRIKSLLETLAALTSRLFAKNRGS